MTFCVGMRVEEGLVAIADTRITTGTEVVMARKVSTHSLNGRPFFIMTSGLRSVRDKALTYFEEVLEDLEDGTREPFTKLYEAVNELAMQIRRVADEDRQYLESSKLSFNLNVLIGGRLSGDKEHKLYLLYPQGNWIDIGPGTPYSIIGAQRYGKPILDRTLQFEDTLRHALKVGVLAFDSTRISSSDVDFPIDVIVYKESDHSIRETRYEKSDLAQLSEEWQASLRNALQSMPDSWADYAFTAPPC